MATDDITLDPERDRLIDIHLDEASIARTTRDIEQERQIAIYDLLDENTFGVINHDRGPYRLNLSLVEDRLVFGVRDEAEGEVMTHLLSLKPFRKVVQDYFLVCESYFDAIKTAPPSRIEAIDMGRRGLHDEGSKLLQSRLDGKIVTDFDTARRLFTLVCALHWKG